MADEPKVEVAVAVDPRVTPGDEPEPAAAVPEAAAAAVATAAAAVALAEETAAHAELQAAEEVSDVKEELSQWQIATSEAVSNLTASLQQTNSRLDALNSLEDQRHRRLDVLETNLLSIRSKLEPNPEPSPQNLSAELPDENEGVPASPSQEAEAVIAAPGEPSPPERRRAHRWI
jgi:hypothetical protein